MAERNVQYVPSVIIAAANTAAVVLTASAVQNASLSALPSLASASLARTYRVRGTLTIISAGTGAFTVQLRQGNGTVGTQVGITNVNGGAAPPLGTQIPFEFWDTAPVGNVYTVVAASATTNASVSAIAEIEAVN